MKLLEFESYYENTVKNYRNCYVAKKSIVSKLSKISIQNCMAPIEDLKEDSVKISRPYLLYFPKNKPSNGVTVGSVHRLKLFILFLVYTCRSPSPQMWPN